MFLKEPQYQIPQIHISDDFGLLYQTDAETAVPKTRSIPISTLRISAFYCRLFMGVKGPYY